MSTNREYHDLMSQLRDARAALSKAEQTLDLIGPADLDRHTALDDLVGGIQAAADQIGERTGTNEREREYQRAAAAPLVDGPDPEPAATIVPRAEPPAEWFREPEGYRNAVDGMDDAEMAAHQRLEPEAGQ